MEIWDLYDYQRQKTGETMKRGDPIPEGRYHLTVRVIIFNAAGQMLIQQRQPFKDGWPNRWDLTVGGCVSAGETSQTAGMREVAEEIGYEVDLTGMTPAITLSSKNVFNDNYILIREIDPAQLKLQPEEVQAAKWADKEEIFEMIDDGRFIPFPHSFIEYLFYRRSVLYPPKGET